MSGVTPPPRKRPRGSMAFSLGSKPVSTRSPDPTSAAMRALAAADSRPQTPHTGGVQLLQQNIPSSPPRPRTADFSHGKDNDSAHPQISVNSTNHSANRSPGQSFDQSHRSVQDSTRLMPPSPANQSTRAAESSNLHFSLFDRMLELSEADSILSDATAGESDVAFQQAHVIRGRVHDGDVSIETRGYTVKGRTRLSRHYIQDVNPTFTPSEKLTQVIIWCLERRIRHLHRKGDLTKSLGSELARVTMNKLLVRMQNKKANLDWSNRRKDEPLPPPMRGKLNTLNEKTLEGFIKYRKALEDENAQWPRVWSDYEALLELYSQELPEAEPPKDPRGIPRLVLDAEKDLVQAADRVLSYEPITEKVSRAVLVKETAEEMLDNMRQRTRPPVGSVELLKALTRHRQS